MFAEIAKSSKLIARDYSFCSAMRHLLLLWFSNDAFIVYYLALSKLHIVNFFST